MAVPALGAACLRRQHGKDGRTFATTMALFVDRARLHI